MEGTWLRKAQNGTAIVYVHGVLSDGVACWRNANGAYWPELLAAEASAKDAGIYVFTYKTTIFSGTYRLGDVVDSLKEHMRLDDVFENQRIVFVAHSMGGIVVRKLLVERVIDFRDRQTMVGLFLIASPSLGSRYANMFGPLARLFGHTQADALCFSQNNSWLLDLDKEFNNLNHARTLRMHGKELVEDVFVVLKRFRFLKQVVAPFSGARYFGEPYKVPDSDHFSIAKPASAQAVQHRQLLRFLSDFSVFGQDQASPSVSEAMAESDALGIAQQRLLTELLRTPFEGETPPEVDQSTLLKVLQEPVTTLVHYALYRWAFWGQYTVGAVHTHFVPLSIEADGSGLPPGLRLECGPHSGLEELLRCNDDLGVAGFLLRGQPGAGKSTLLQHWEQMLCWRALHQWSCGEAMSELPLYVRLAELGQSDDPVQALQAMARDEFPECPALHALLDPSRRADDAPHLRMMLDGLNELRVSAAEQRPRRAQFVASEVWRRIKPGRPMLLSTRPYQGFDLAHGEHPLSVVPVTVLEWDDARIQTYLQRRFKEQPGAAARHWQRLHRDRTALALCRVPMNLAGQCELLASGVTRLVTDRADLYRRWLWQRLVRELRKNEAEPDNPLWDDELLTPEDRTTLRQQDILIRDDLPPWPVEGMLLQSLFRQALAQWRSASLTKPGVSPEARGEVEVPWDGRFNPAEGPALDPVVGWLARWRNDGSPDGRLRHRWHDAVQRLDLGQRSRISGAFRWRHQSWGEYLASVNLLAPTPSEMSPAELARLKSELQPLALPRSDAAEIEHQQAQVLRHWGKVPEMLRGLLASGISVPLSKLREELRASEQWSEHDLSHGEGIWRREYVQAGILTEDLVSDTCTVDLHRWADYWDLARTFQTENSDWTENPLAWQRLVMEQLWKPLREEVFRQLEPSLAEELQHLPGRLTLPSKGDLDEVLSLALLGLRDPEPWLAWLATNGLWQSMAGALAPIARNLEPDSKDGAPGAWQLPNTVLNHVRRLLLLYVVDAGKGVLENLKRAGVVGAGDQPSALSREMVGFNGVLNAHWQTEWDAAFESGQDLRLRMQAAFSLGELGDNLRYEWRRVTLHDGTTRSGLRLKPQHWVPIGKAGHESLFRVGSDVGDIAAFPDEMPPLEGLRLPYFEVMTYPVTVQEWRYFAQSGYDDANSPWWRMAGPHAQAWLRGRCLHADAQRTFEPIAFTRTGWHDPLLPMTLITYWEAEAYMHWASPVYGESEHRGDPRSGSLKLGIPAELFWEAGMRGPSNEAAPASDKLGRSLIPELVRNHEATRWSLPSAVGVFSGDISPAGVSEASGNVSQWCSNSFDPGPDVAGYSSPAAVAAAMSEAPTETTPGMRAHRGGSYRAIEQECRTARRHRLHPDSDYKDLGVRLIRVSPLNAKPQ